MKKIILISIVILFAICSRSWALPECEGSPLDIHNQKEIEAITWHNCEGIIFIKGLEEDPNARSKYDGEWQKGKPNGQGTSTFNDGAIYIGKWKNGLHHGKGTYIWADGTKYVGEHEFHAINGNGIMYYNDGRVSVGTWIEGEFFGKEYAPGEYKEESGEIIKLREDKRKLKEQRKKAEIKEKERVEKKQIRQKEKEAFEKAKTECEEIGFKKGTEKFGECVLDLTE